jgi:hypothetical protein
MHFSSDGHGLSGISDGAGVADASAIGLCVVDAEGDGVMAVAEQPATASSARQITIRRMFDPFPWWRV